MKNDNTVNVEYRSKLVTFRNNIDDIIKAKELLLTTEDNKHVTIIDKQYYFDKFSLQQLKKLSKNATRLIIKLTKRDIELRKAMMNGLLV